MFQPLIEIYRRDNLCIIAGDVHEFIDNCLIPVDPCNYLTNPLNWNICYCPKQPALKCEIVVTLAPASSRPKNNPYLIETYLKQFTNLCINSWEGENVFQYGFETN